MNRYIFPAVLGVFLGTLWGVILIIGYGDFRHASYILYGNDWYIPLMSNITIFGVLLPTLLTYTYWEPFCKQLIIDTAEGNITLFDEESEDDGDDED